MGDGIVLEETDEFLLISYEADDAVSHGNTPSHGDFLRTILPGDHKHLGWYVVGMDIHIFKKHYQDTLIQTVGIGAAILLFAVLIIVFLSIVQRYQLAHLSIERLQKIENILSNFVPETAKKIIKKDPERALLDKYLRDATILFLDPDPTQQARNAVRTAVEIQKKCLQVPKIGNADLFPIQVNIGIGSGQVYMGSTKMRGTGRDRWTFTASGSVTILAARLSEFGQGGQILVGEKRLDG